MVPCRVSMHQRKVALESACRTGSATLGTKCLVMAPGMGSTRPLIASPVANATSCNGSAATRYACFRPEPIAMILLFVIPAVGQQVTCASPLATRRVSAESTSHVCPVSMVARPPMTAAKSLATCRLRISSGIRGTAYRGESSNRRTTTFLPNIPSAVEQAVAALTDLVAAAASA
jgi:hypothetical protein